MQNSWPGLGLPISNVVLEEVFIAKSIPVLLSDIPGMPTQVRLPATTQGVKLRTLDAAVWFALDYPPGPIPPPQTGNVVEDNTFVLGDIVLPGELLALALPDDSLLHSLYLLSQASGAWVLVTALTEVP